MQKHIYCSAGITPKLHDVLVQFIVSQRDVTEYVVYLSSPGGSPWVGGNLYSFIKSRPEQTTIYNMGNVDSAAVPFFLGFKRRLAVPSSTFMIHPTTFSREILPAYYSLFDARKAMHELESIEARTVNIIFAETSGRSKEPLTQDGIRNAMFQTTVVPAERALVLGVVDAIEEPTLPREDVIYLTESSLASLPGGPQPPPSSPPAA